MKKLRDGCKESQQGIISGSENGFGQEPADNEYYRRRKKSIKPEFEVFILKMQWVP